MKLTWPLYKNIQMKNLNVMIKQMLILMTKVTRKKMMIRQPHFNKETLIVISTNPKNKSKSLHLKKFHLVNALDWNNQITALLNMNKIISMLITSLKGIKWAKCQTLAGIKISQLWCKVCFKCSCKICLKAIKLKVVNKIWWAWCKIWCKEICQIWKCHFSNLPNIKKKIINF